MAQYATPEIRSRANTALDLHDIAVSIVPVVFGVSQKYSISHLTEAGIIGGACVSALQCERSARIRLRSLLSPFVGEPPEKRSTINRVVEFVPYRLRGWGLAVMGVGFGQELAALPTMNSEQIYQGLVLSMAGMAMTAAGMYFRPEEKTLVESATKSPEEIQATE